MNDDIYIATLKEQINGGMYEHLFFDNSEPRDPVPKKDLVFLDIGANIGLVSIYAVPYCKRIVAVEPCIETFVQLQKNTEHYSIISCDRHALAATDENVGFYINDINFTASSTVNTYGKYEPNYVMGAKLTTLLRVWNLDHVDVCKIDAEGAEDAALSYVELQLAKEIITTYYVECHNTPVSKWEITLGNLVRMFSQLGYHEMTISGMAITATRP